MIPKQAIEKAITAGWKVNGHAVYSWRVKRNGTLEFNYVAYKWQEVALDPSFWRSLEKPLGWYAGEGKEKGEDFCSIILRGGNTEEWWNNVLK